MEFIMSLFNKITNLFKKDNTTKESTNINTENKNTDVPKEPTSSITVSNKVVDIPIVKPDMKEPLHISDKIILAAKEEGITNKNELAMLLAQLHHESSGFTRLEERFNYSAARLYEVFPKYFKSIAEAQATILKGEKAIADKVYGGRMGNSPTEGYKYRGRGFIQLTGKNNYTHYGRVTGLDLVNDPDQLLLHGPATKVSLAFWKGTVGLQAAARSGDVTLCTRLINGGTNGLSDRRRLFNNYLKEV